MNTIVIIIATLTALILGIIIYTFAVKLTSFIIGKINNIKSKSYNCVSKSIYNGTLIETYIDCLRILNESNESN